jgi:transcriptional antiterminator NusG
MDQSEDKNVDQPALTDDEKQIEAMEDESPALARAEERAEDEAELDAEAVEEVAEEERAEADSEEQALEDEPTSSIDELSARSGGPSDAEAVEEVVEEEVVAEREEATFESEEPDVPGATGAADPGTEEEAETTTAETTKEEPAAEEDEQPAASTDEIIDLDDATPKETVEPAAADAEAALAAAVDEAFDEADVQESEPEPEFLPGDWYVVHTYAGYENKVKADLETRVASMNMEEQIYEVVIPMEDVVEVKGGKKVTVQRKVFPGYLLVRMELSDDSWYVVRNTPGVTGFVGSGTKPIPLSEKEVDKILKRKGEAEKPRPKAEWQMNDPVRVTTGPFANFQGVISEVDDERQKVKVLVNIFGRETPVELSYDQISKV